MIKLCVIETNENHVFPRENEQRLLRNMDVHVVVLDLLKIPYDKIEDTRMNHIMKLAHNLLQYFCYENPINQTKLYDLYFNDFQQISEVKEKHFFFCSFGTTSCFFLRRNKKLKRVVLSFEIIFNFVKRSQKNTFNISFI